MEGEVQKGSDKPGMLLHVLFQLLYCSNGYIGGWLAGGWCVGGKWWLSLRHGGRSQKKKKTEIPAYHTYLPAAEPNNCSAPRRPGILLYCRSYSG